MQDMKCDTATWCGKSHCQCMPLGCLKLVLMKLAVGIPFKYFNWHYVWPSPPMSHPLHWFPLPLNPLCPLPQLLSCCGWDVICWTDVIYAFTSFCDLVSIFWNLFSSQSLSLTSFSLVVTALIPTLVMDLHLDWSDSSLCASLSIWLKLLSSSFLGWRVSLSLSSWCPLKKLTFKMSASSHSYPESSNFESQ